MAARAEAAPHVIHPTAVYTVAQATAALSLRAGSLPREIRSGRLNCCKRCGRHFLTGEAILRWLQSGLVTKYHQGRGDVAPMLTAERNGHHSEVTT